MRINTVPSGLNQSPNNTKAIPFLYKGKLYYKYGGKILAGGGNPDDPALVRNYDPIIGMEPKGMPTTGMDMSLADSPYGTTGDNSFGLNDATKLVKNITEGVTQSGSGSLSDLLSGIGYGALNTTPIGSVIGTAAQLVSGIGEAATIGNKVISPYGDYYENNAAAGLKGWTDPMGQWTTAIGQIGRGDTKKEKAAFSGLDFLNLMAPGIASGATETLENKYDKRKSKEAEEEAAWTMYQEGRDAKKAIDEKALRSNYTNLTGFFPYGGRLNDPIDLPDNTGSVLLNYRNMSSPDRMNPTVDQRASIDRLRSSINTISNVNINNDGVPASILRSAPGSTSARMSLFNPMGLAFGGMSDNNLPLDNSIPIDNNAEVVTNDQGGIDGSHEQGDNIPVYNKQGDQSAVVEPGEVVVDLPNGQKFALSKRLGTAQMYMQLVNSKNELNKILQSTPDTFKRNSIKRDIYAIDSKLNEIPRLQEQMKAIAGMENDQAKLNGGEGLPEGVEEFAFGGRINQLPNGIKILANAGLIGDPPGDDIDQTIKGLISGWEEYSNPKPKYINKKREKYDPYDVSWTKIDPKALIPYEEQMRVHGITPDLLEEGYGDYKKTTANPTIEDYLEKEFESYPAKLPDRSAKAIKTEVPKGEYINRNISGSYIDDQGIKRIAILPRGNNNITMPSVLETEYNYSNIGDITRDNYPFSDGRNSPKEDKQRRKKGDGNKGNGINLGSVINEAGEFLPMLDNIINAQLANKYPKPEPPEQYTYTPIDTTVDISAAENAIRNSARDAKQYARRNASSVQNAIAAGNTIDISVNPQIAQLYQNKINTEKQLENENVQGFNRINTANVDMRNEYYDMLDKIKAGKIQDISRNMANLQDDFTAMLTRRDMKDYQKKQLIADMVQNSDTNSWLGLAQNPEFTHLFVEANSKEQWKTIRDNAAKIQGNQMIVDWIDKNVFGTK